MRDFVIVTLFFLLVGLLAACGSQPPAPNANRSNTAANNPLETKTPAPDQTTNDAPTLTPAFKGYCEAMKAKNEAALRKIYSVETIRTFESQMKDDKIKTLVEFLETEIPDKVCEIRNEQITGDTAVAEIKTDPYPNGLKIVFVKENGEWKLTNKSPGSITQTAPNAAK